MRLTGQPPHDAGRGLVARGTADALALYHRYHDAGHIPLCADGAMARELYEAMETARCEALGGGVPGAAGNIDAKIGPRLHAYMAHQRSCRCPLSTAAGYLIRHLATGRDAAGGGKRHGSVARIYRRTGIWHP